MITLLYLAPYIGCVLGFILYLACGFTTSFIYNKYYDPRYIDHEVILALSATGPFGLVIAICYYFFCVLPQQLSGKRK